MRSFRAVVVLLCLALAGALSPVISAQAVGVTQQGTYYPVKSARLLDTRSGLGAPKRPLGAGQTLQLAVSGQGGVPTSGIAGVVLNLTVTGATANSYLVAYPSGSSRPKVSTINFTKGVTRANIATVPLGAGGKIAIYNSGGSVSVLVDVMGFYASNDVPMQTLGKGNEFTTVTLQRLIDTRRDPSGALAPYSILDLYVNFGENGSLSKSVKAVALNITAVNATGSGHLSAWDGTGAPPATSTLNYGRSDAIANMALVKTALCTDQTNVNCQGTPPVQFSVYNGSAGPVQVLVDLVGVYYNDGTVGLRFKQLPPRRISDSRTPLNGKALAPRQVQALTAPTTVAGDSTAALVANAAIIAPTASTYLTLYPGGTTKPGISNLNVSVGMTAANGALIGLSSANKFNLYNSVGKGNFIIDVTGRFDATAASVSQQARGRQFAARTPNSASPDSHTQAPRRQQHALATAGSARELVSPAER